MSNGNWFSRLFSREPSGQGKSESPEPTATTPLGSPVESPAHAFHHAPQPQQAEDAVPAEWKVGDEILDLYEVKKVHEGGGMGLVYHVHHKSWNIDLAVKSPRPEYFQTQAHKENFIREAETWVNLGLHPHIVSCYYVRTLGGIPRVFAEYVEGGNLSDWIRTRKLYEGGREKALERILDIAIQFAWGLHYSHEQGLVHQDVKPANVMMTVDGTAKVTDFGLAKARVAVGEQRELIPGHSVMVSAGGMTPAYCSPEQAEGKKLTYRTDIYSWAVSIFEMFVAGVTWPSGTVVGEILEEYCQSGSSEDHLPRMPHEIANLLAQCLEHDPAARPKDTAEVAAALREIYGHEIAKPYSREAPRSVELKADGLNNRGVSYLDLGREDDAIRCWQEALDADPQHLQANFNFGYLNWRNGKITDDVYVTQMRELEKTRDADYWRCLAWIHLERGDIEAVDSIQSRYKIEDEKFNKALEDRDRPVGRLLCALGGHTQPIASACFSPNGRYVLSVSTDQTARLWEIATGQELSQFAGHNGPVLSVCFSPQGQYFLSGGEDKIIRLWDVERGLESKRFVGHTGRVTSASFSPDGRYILSASNDETVRLWEVSSGKELKRFEGHVDDVNSVSFSPDGHYALSGSSDKTVRLWEFDWEWEF